MEAPQFREDAYWANYLLQEREVRRIEREMKSSNRTKQKREVFGIEDSDGDDCVLKRKHPLTPTPTPKKQKIETAGVLRTAPNSTPPAFAPNNTSRTDSVLRTDESLEQQRDEHRRQTIDRRHT